MMPATIVVPGDIAGRIQHLAGLGVETGGVLLARPVRDGGSLRLLVRELAEVPESAYDRREEHQLLIRSEGYVPALALAEAGGCVPVWFHTHPGQGAWPGPSTQDKEVSRQLSDVFRLRAASDYYGWLIVSPDPGGLRFAGQLDDRSAATDIGRMWVVGQRLALYFSSGERPAALHGMYDRNVRAFGEEVQRVLSSIMVAIAGCGGTGSAVAEQLVRLGVRHLILVDPDDLSESNVTRVYGSRRADAGRLKVDVLADHLESVMPGLSVRREPSMVTAEETARLISGADVVFGCTDDNAGRMVLSRLSTYMLTPVIDCGVLLSSDAGGHLAGIHGRVTVLYPGQACLICRGRVDLARAGSELLSQDERGRLVGEGYAPALPGAEPAVIAYTTAVAAAAVAELLERIAGYGPEPAPGEVLLRLHDRELSTNSQQPCAGHYCDPAAGRIGVGITEPFLEQTWPDG